jgi:hypothetical protein
MKKIMIAICLLISATCFSQVKPPANDMIRPVSKKDTVIVKLYPVKDTVSSKLLYVGNNNAVYYADGFMVISGFAKKTDKGFEWAEKTAIYFLDANKKRLNKVIQILQ